MRLRDLLADLARDPWCRIDLAQAALLLARDAYPRLKPRPYLRRLDQMAEYLRPRLTGSAEARTRTLTRYLFEQCGFTGNIENFYDPRNSYLNEVLDRQVGLPITLSLVAVAVGQRAGLDVSGVALPGHFIAKVRHQNQEILFDPFNGGRILDVADCEALVSAVTGRPFVVTPDVLAELSPAAFLSRMLTNLKVAYQARRSYLRAARVVHRLVQLEPEEPGHHRDRGLLLVQGGRPGRAIDPLRRYLAMSPQAADTAAVTRVLKQAWATVARWN